MGRGSGMSFCYMRGCEGCAVVRILRGWVWLGWAEMVMVVST